MIQRLVLLLMLAAPSLGLAQAPLSSSQMEEDLFFIADELRMRHAGLQRFTSEEQFDEILGEVVYGIEEQPSFLEYYRLLSRAVSQVHCGHTAVRLSGRQRSAVLAERQLLPFQVHMVGERAWILDVIGESQGLKAGQEILSINGQSIAEIRSIAFAHLFGDGFIESGKQRALESRFSEHYALLVEQDGATREKHSLRIAGMQSELLVSGVTHQAYTQRSPRSAARPYMALTSEGESTSRLYISTFGDEGNGKPDYPAQLEAHFVALKQAGTQNLILDLRGNGGGDDMYGALLVSYLSPKAFGYFDNIVVTPDYEGGGGVVERDGQRFVTAHPGLQVQQPAENRFSGRVFILMDGWTFSTAADVATVAHHNGLATFVGEESGGGYDGNTSGSSGGFSLPSSGMQLRVPRWMYTTANIGHKRFGRGAPADYPVRPTIEQALAGVDAEVHKVLELIAQEPAEEQSK